MLIHRLRLKSTVLALSALVALIFSISGCGEREANTRKPSPPAPTQPTSIRWLTGDEPPREQAEHNAFAVEVRKGGENWSSANSFQFQAGAIAAGDFYLIRPAADVPLKSAPVSRPGQPVNPNVSIPLQCSAVPGKQLMLPRSAGKLTLVCRAEMQLGGLYGVFDSNVTLSAGQRVQSIGGLWRPPSGEKQTGEGFVRVYLADPRDPKVALSNIIQIKANLE